MMAANPHVRQILFITLMVGSKSQKTFALYSKTLEVPLHESQFKRDSVSNHGLGVAYANCRISTVEHYID